MKNILLVLAILSGPISAAQTEKTETINKLIASAEIAGKKFVSDLNGSSLFSKYYTLDKKESSIVGDFPFSNFQSGNYNVDNVIGYKLTFTLKSEFFPIKNTHDIKFEIYLNRQLKADYSEIWNSKWSPAVDGNLEVKYDILSEEYHRKFILSQLDFIKKLEGNKILKSTDISDYLKKNYSNKTFREPELTRNSLPPYDVHFEVTENNCSDCLKLDFPVDTFEGLKSSQVGVRFIN